MKRKRKPAKPYRGYAPRPDFPARISVPKKRFWWKKSEVEGWLDRQKEKRPMM
jgi:hypothetical protein